jgi:hypothetical protein
MTGDQKKILILMVLGLLWIGLLAKQWFTASEPMRVPLTNVTGIASTTRSTRASSSGLHVQLDLLAAARTQREMTFTAPRNIFALPRFDNQVATGSPGDGAILSADDGARQQHILESLAQYHYLGFIRMIDDRRPNAAMAVLTRNDDLHVVRVGQTVEDHVVVKTITPESVTLQDRTSRIEQMVPLSEEPGTAPIDPTPQ